MNTPTLTEIRHMRESLEHQRREAYERARTERKKKVSGPLGRLTMAILEPVSAERRKDRQLQQLERSLIDITATSTENSAVYDARQRSYSMLAEGSRANTAVRIDPSGEIGMTQLKTGREVADVSDVTGGRREITFDTLSERSSIRDIKQLNRNLGEAAVRMRDGETPLPAYGEVNESAGIAPGSVESHEPGASPTPEETKSQNEYELAA